MITGLLALAWGAMTSAIFLKWIERDLHHRLERHLNSERSSWPARWMAHIREISVATLVVVPAIGRPALTVTSLIGFVVARNLMLQWRVMHGG